MQLDLLEPKRTTKFYRVKELLRSRGPAGVDMSELNAISYRYGAIIHRLRQEGHVIYTIPINPKTGHYKYLWEK